MQSSMIRDFAEDGTPLEIVSLWPETVIAHLLWHCQGRHDHDWVRGIMCQRKTVRAP